MPYQILYAAQIGTGLRVPGTFQDANWAKLGHTDGVFKFAITLTAAQLNAVKGAGAIALITAGANQRIRVLSLGGYADGAMGVAGGGLTVDFQINSTSKGSYDLTAGVSANAAWPITSSSVTQVAGTVGKSLDIVVTGGSVTNATPMTFFIEVSVERIS